MLFSKIKVVVVINEFWFSPRHRYFNTSASPRIWTCDTRPFLLAWAGWGLGMRLFGTRQQGLNAAGAGHIWTFSPLHGFNNYHQLASAQALGRQWAAPVIGHATIWLARSNNSVVSRKAPESSPKLPDGLSVGISGWSRDDGAETKFEKGASDRNSPTRRIQYSTSAPKRVTQFFPVMNIIWTRYHHINMSKHYCWAS